MQCIYRIECSETESWQQLIHPYINHFSQTQKLSLSFSCLRNIFCTHWMLFQSLSTYRKHFLNFLFHFHSIPSQCSRVNSARKILINNFVAENENIQEKRNYLILVRCTLMFNLINAFHLISTGHCTFQQAHRDTHTRVIIVTTKLNCKFISKIYYRKKENKRNKSPFISASLWRRQLSSLCCWYCCWLLFV